jgi:hypothetical protein
MTFRNHPVAHDARPPAHDDASAAGSSRGWWHRSRRFAALGAFALAAAACTGGLGDGDLTGGAGGGGAGGGGGSLPDPGGGGSGAPLQITPVFSVQNRSSAPVRGETIRASVPFPEGMVSDLSTVGVRDYATAWLPLQYWPDDSVRVAQAQFFDLLQPNETKTYEVVQGVTADTRAFAPFDWIGDANGQLAVGAQVRDTFNNVYESRVVLGSGEVVQETAYVRVEKWRTFHEHPTGGGIGRDYLTSTFYVTTYRFQPFVTIDWILGNDYLGADNPSNPNDPNLFPLGPVDVNAAEFFCEGFSDVRGHMPVENELTDLGMSGARRRFRAMENDWIGDGQCRRYRFYAYRQGPGADPTIAQTWQDSFDGFATETLFPLADLETWQQTKALGLLGGPIDPPPDVQQRANSAYGSWRGGNHFGTWGSAGDAKGSATTGTPRNGPMTNWAGWAVQSGDQRLIHALEQQAFAQSMRTYHLTGLQVGTTDPVLLWDGVPNRTPISRNLSPESFGRRAMWANGDPYAAYRTRAAIAETAHGWNHFDEEHFSIDQCFDYWTFTGDAATLDEIRMLGEALKGLMRLQDFNTANVRPVRAEGWCMQAFTQAYVATRDETFRLYATRRVNEIVNPRRFAATRPEIGALSTQGNYAGTRFPGNHRFYMPWQHGAVLYGFLGAYVHFRDPAFLVACNDVPQAVEHAWVRNFNDPNFGFVENGIRYYCPIESEGNPIPPSYWDNTPGVGVRWGTSPLGGASVMLIGGLYRLAQLAETPEDRIFALQKARDLSDRVEDPWRWEKWRFVLPEELLPQPQ